MLYGLFCTDQFNQDKYFCCLTNNIFFQYIFTIFSVLQNDEEILWILQEKL